MYAKCMFSFRQMEEVVMVTGVNYSPKELLTSLSQLRLNHLPQCLDYQQMCTCVILFIFFPSLEDVTKKLKKACEERDTAASALQESQMEQTSQQRQKEQLQEELATVQSSLAQAEDKCRSLLAFSLLSCTIAILFWLNLCYNVTPSKRLLWFF